MSSKTYQSTSDETRIDVFVRCRGRNARETRENSAVVVGTNGIKGKTVELSGSTNAASNKTYSFDAVFSPMADQQMIFDDVVRPVLDEVRKGFNCTIFAYGQTGTGKTYTMSGDISDNRHTLLSDDAGIIPRVLHAIFLSLNSAAKTDGEPEASVKVSYIELYNEELRDLLSSNEKSNLKIYEGDGKRGGAALVQGMEEQYITSAKKGIEMLRTGNHRRQVAATKCNDLSSRSHTIFTVTVHTKQTLSSGEEIVCSGKLNLVDLAGSENIGRSGAENKRATEAGLINKSLLTLGRVINALVDRSSHIPYRESKLTRILQDSLGGRTKTCIIATLSPANSNIEETVSTLDYAFRAKNIKNKPQINQLMPKVTVLREFAVEMERLKSELNATRQRNGVYLTAEAHEELKNEAASLRIQAKEQDEKIEIIERKLARKTQDLLEITETLDMLQSESEVTRGLLEKESEALSHTKRLLQDEVSARKRHERLAHQLAAHNREVTAMFERAVTDNKGLHRSLERRTELHARNHVSHTRAQHDVASTTSFVESRLSEFHREQRTLVDSLKSCMARFVSGERGELENARAKRDEREETFARFYDEAATHITDSQAALHEKLDRIQDDQGKVAAALSTEIKALETTINLVPEGVLNKMQAFDEQFQECYTALGEDLSAVFQLLSVELDTQRREVQRLHEEMDRANDKLHEDQHHAIDALSEFWTREKAARKTEKRELMQRIHQLVELSVQQQDLRFAEMHQSTAQLETARRRHVAAGSSIAKGRERLREQATKMSEDWRTTQDRLGRLVQAHAKTTGRNMDELHTTTASLYTTTSALVKGQGRILDDGVQTLNDAIGATQAHSEALHNRINTSLKNVGDTTRDYLEASRSSLAATCDRIEDFSDVASRHASELYDGLSKLDKSQEMPKRISELRQRAEVAKLEAYAVTGQTPSRRDYVVASVTPQLESSAVLDEHRFPEPEEADLSTLPRAQSPSKMSVFVDERRVSETPDETEVAHPPPSVDVDSSRASSLRELDVNNMMKSSEGRLAAGKKPNTSNGPEKTSSKRSADSSTDAKFPTKMRKLRSTRSTTRAATTT